MKKVFTSMNLIDVVQLKDLLEQEGIACLIRNDILAGRAPEIPFTETFPELWVQNDADLPKAQTIKADWQNARQIIGESWQCPTCNESLEPQFSTCWNCGTNRPLNAPLRS